MLAEGPQGQQQTRKVRLKRRLVTGSLQPIKLAGMVSLARVVLGARSLCQQFWGGVVPVSVPGHHPWSALYFATEPLAWLPDPELGPGGVGVSSQC